MLSSSADKQDSTNKFPHGKSDLYNNDTVGFHFFIPLVIYSIILDR